jgi:hypothetical protein
MVLPTSPKHPSNCFQKLLLYSHVFILCTHMHACPPITIACSSVSKLSYGSTVYMPFHRSWKSWQMIYEESKEKKNQAYNIKQLCAS